MDGAGDGELVPLRVFTGECCARCSDLKVNTLGSAMRGISLRLGQAIVLYY